MTSTKDAVATRTGIRSATGSPVVMLVMATLGFAVNFWAWALISPLGPLFRDNGHLGTLSRVRRRADGRGPGARRVARPDRRSARSPTGTAAG